MLKLFGFLCFLGVVLAAPPETDGGWQNAHAEPKRDGRIIGGTSTTIDKFPYQISLQHEMRRLCGGSIISPEWVLTAAHCTLYFLSGYTVRAGSSKYDTGGTVYTVAKIIRHPGFNKSIADYDIAVIHISGTFQFGRNVQTIGLANKSPSHGSLAVITGWGHTSKGGKPATVLQYLEVPVVSNRLCRHYYRHRLPITDRMMCAGFITGDKRFCLGDSGSPLVSGGVQVGIASFTFCGDPDYLDGYASVANLRTWIKQHSGV